MAAELLTDASRALDANGNPFSGAKWYFYATGTLTPQAVYADAGLSVSLGAVVTADAGGKFVPIYFDATKAYRGILENSTGTTTIYDIDPINPSILYELGLSGGAGMIGIGNGRTQADKNAEIVSVFDYIPFAEQAAILAGTSTYDCTDDIHDARDAVDGTGKTLRFPGGTYYVGELEFSGSDYILDTSAATFQQKPGLTGDEGLHPIITFPQSASSIRMGDARLIGNIATDEDEFSHGIAVISANNITIGDVSGEDIRGDVLYTYGRNTSEAEYQRNLTVGVVRGANILRCIVAMAGGDATIEGIVQEGGVGYRCFDPEPNAGAGYQPVSARVGFVRGSTVQITSAAVGNINAYVSIDEADLDGDLLEDSTPGYTGYPGANAIALAINRTNTVRIGKLTIRNYDSYPVSLADLWKSVQIGSMEFSGCGAVEAVFKSIVVQQGAAGNGVLKVDHVTGILASSAHMIFRSDTGLLKIDVGSVDTDGGKFGARLTGHVGTMNMDLGGGGGEICFTICEDMHVGAATITDSATAYGFFQCANLTLNEWTATFGSGLDYTSASTAIVAINSAVNGSFVPGINMLVGTTAVSVGGVQLLGAQGAAVANAVNAVGVPTQAEFNAFVTQFNALAARLRSHGIIAT